MMLVTAQPPFQRTERMLKTYARCRAGKRSAIKVESIGHDMLMLVTRSACAGMARSEMRREDHRDKERQAARCAAPRPS